MERFKKIVALKNGVGASKDICETTEIEIVEKRRKPVNSNLEQIRIENVRKSCTISP